MSESVLKINETCNNRKCKNLNKSSLSVRTFCVILGFVFLFFSRIIVAVGVNSLFNFFHYIYFIIFALFYLINDIANRRVSGLIYYIISFLFIIFLSMFVNAVNPLNLLISFTVTSQPFVLVYILSKEKNKKALKILIESIFIINAVFAYFQFFVLGLRIDLVKGIFLDMGAGHHVCGAVALIAMFYYFYNRTGRLKYFKILIQFVVVFLCDNKQSIFIFLAAIFIYMLMSHSSAMKKLQTFLFLAFFCLVIYLLGLTVFTPILHYLNVEKVMNGVSSKLYVFQYFYEKSSFLNYFIGFGPGMTVSRTAQILPEYQLLSQFGATISSMQVELYSIQQSNWITNTITGSSMFSYYFSYSGFLGDFGIIGLILILFGFIKYIYKCYATNCSKLIFIFFLLHGLIFQWLEEPQFVAAIILTMYVCKNNSDELRKQVSQMPYSKLI